MTVHVVCGPSSYNPQIIMDWSLQDSTASREVTVDCPTGTHLTGMGYEVLFDLDGDVIITGIEPDVDLESATIYAHENAGTAANCSSAGSRSAW